MSDTPRTDAICTTPIMGDECTPHKWNRLCSLARQLERELEIAEAKVLGQGHIEAQRDQFAREAASARVGRFHQPCAAHKDVPVTFTIQAVTAIPVCFVCHPADTVLNERSPIHVCGEPWERGASIGCLVCKMNKRQSDNAPKMPRPGMNRAFYETFIRDDLAWLARQPQSLERQHIEDVLRNAADRLYGPDSAPEERRP